MRKSEGDQHKKAGGLIVDLGWVATAVANFARVGRFRLEIMIGFARLPWVIFASGMSESEEKIGVARLPWIIFGSGMSESESEEDSMTASSYPSSAPSCSSQLFARRSDMIDFP